MACGAKKSEKQGGGLCTRKNGWGTDHPGTGKCKSHGGASHGRPPIHGRYSKIKSPRLQELIAEFSADDDPLDLLPELALLRGLITDFVERYGEFSEALIHWHESFYQGEATPKPHRILDLVSAAQFIGQIGQIAARIEKSKSEGAISMGTLDYVMQQMGGALVQATQETIDDEPTRTKLLNLVESRWGNIRLDPKSAGARP